MNFLNFFRREPLEVPQRTHLDRVHLLVHPGDGTESRDEDTDRMLLSRMAERAISLQTNHEIAVVLLQMSEADFQASMADPAYAGSAKNLLQEIRRMSYTLPNNLIVVPGASSVFDQHRLDIIFDEVRTRIETLDFSIDPETELLAYGEMITRCVPVGASRFRRHFGLTRPPTIDANCTDAIINEPRMWGKNGIRLSVSECLSEGGLRFIPLGEKESA